MSITKKGSRKIHVGNFTYLWQVKDNIDNKTLAIQRKDKENVLLCYVSEWDCGDIESLPITPKTVKTIILQSLKSGWQPDKNGMPVFKFRITNEILKQMIEHEK